MSTSLILIRHLILELANIADLATISSALYKNHPDLSELHKPIRKALEFFKYLRNVYVGHFVPDLTDKTFEWIPHANLVLGSTEPDKQLVVSWFALETAINTYSDTESGHKIFDSETDLNYPPDRIRFLDFLGNTVLGASSYVARLIPVTRSYVVVPDLAEDLIQLSVTAGRTDFSVLRKGKR